MEVAQLSALWAVPFVCVFVCVLFTNLTGTKVCHLKPFWHAKLVELDVVFSAFARMTETATTLCGRALTLFATPTRPAALPMTAPPASKEIGNAGWSLGMEYVLDRSGYTRK